VILGSSLIWTGFNGLDFSTVVFAGIAMVVRVPIYLLTLLRSNVDRRGRLLIAWFGPSGLSSLLLVLLPVFAGIPGSTRIFEVCSFIVILSVVIHGGSPMLLARIAKKQGNGSIEVTADEADVEPEEPPEVRPDRSLPVIENTETEDAVGSQSVSIKEMLELQASGQPVFVLDVRTDRSLETSDHRARNSLRVNPEFSVAEASKKKLPKDAWLIAYCA
jgi:NhaP-type Na+/H+ or K+/H+ antiporter